ALVDGVRTRRAAADVARDFGTAIVAFPAELAARRASFADLLVAARAFVVACEGRGPGGAGAAASWLHRIVRAPPSADGPGATEVVRVERGQFARRFRGTLGGAGMAELMALLEAHDPAKLVVVSDAQQRGYAIPGEAFATLVFVAPAATHTLTKSMSQAHAG